MSRRQRFWLYGLGAFLFSVVLIIATAFSQGADPFHPRTRHIWALSLVAAGYISIRGALLFEKLSDPERGSKRSGNSILGFLGGKGHAIDRRMEARKARVAAARAKEQAEGDTND